MSNLYNVKLKIGKRNYSTKLYASNHNTIIEFVNNNLLAEIVSIEQIVYQAPKGTSYASDDPLTYKPTMYFMVANNKDHKMTQIIMQTIKLSRSMSEVYQDMQTLLKLDNTSDIKSMVSVSVSDR